MDAITEKTAKPRRRWLRFSLRTLLIVVTVLSVPLGWVGWEMGQVRRERATIAWVEEMGGYVSFHTEEDPFGGANRFRSGADKRSWWEESTDKWFGKRVRWVRLNYTKVSDLSPLAELKNLNQLVLNNTQVSDLSPLVELKGLERLFLTNTQVSFEQVQELRQAFPNCRIKHSIRDEK